MRSETVRRWVSALVVIGIVVVGVGLLLPATRRVRDGSPSTYTRNNLRQISLGCQNFHDTFLRFPGNGTGVGDGFPAPDSYPEGSFFYQILPYVEQDDLFRNPTRDKGRILRTYLDYTRLRGGVGANGPVTDFAVNLVALYDEGKPPNAANTKDTLNLGTVQDGSSNTVLVGQKSIHPSDYDTADPAVDDTFLKLSSGGASTVGARYAVGATTVVKTLTVPPPVEYLSPVAVRDADADPGVRTDRFGGPHPNRVMFAFLDGSVRSMSYPWLAPGRTIPVRPVPWGTPPTAGTFDRVSQFRAMLTPNGREEVVFE